MKGGRHAFRIVLDRSRDDSSVARTPRRIKPVRTAAVTKDAGIRRSLPDSHKNRVISMMSGETSVTWNHGVGQDGNRSFTGRVGNPAADSTGSVTAEAHSHEWS